MQEKGTPCPAERARQIGETLEHLHGLIARQVRQGTLAELQDHDLSLRQLGLLFHLREAGTVHVSAIAADIQLSLPATSHMIDRLVRRGLVWREENPRNRRQKQVALAPRGEELLARLGGSAVAAYAGLFGRLPPEVLERFGACCLELRAHLPPSPPCALALFPSPHARPSQEDS